jgi:hypothetical protein
MKKVVIPHQPWEYLLEPNWLAWREWQWIKGNNPDPCLEDRLRKKGLWPPKDGQKPDRS